MEIESGVHRVDGVRGANCYVVIGEDGIMVVDTGMPGNARRIVGHIARLGRKPEDIEHIVLTHADIDHCGSAAELRMITGARLAIHAGDAPVLAGEMSMKRPRGILAPLFVLMSKMMRFQPVKPDIVLKDGDSIDGYQVVHTPGHTQGSISLYRPDGVIFVGDALKSDTKGNPLPPSRLMSLDVVQAVDSVRKIARLQFNILLPGHGAPVMSQASRKVRSLL